jgi:hypothetical protein
VALIGDNPGAVAVMVVDPNDTGLTVNATFCWPAPNRKVPGTVATAGLLDVRVKLVTDDTGEERLRTSVPVDVRPVIANGFGVSVPEFPTVIFEVAVPRPGAEAVIVN